MTSRQRVPGRLETDGPFNVPRGQLVTVLCTDDGTPTGDPEITGDYSVTPGIFWVPVPTGLVWHVCRIVVYVQGAGQLFANNYGPLPTLTNGLSLGPETAAGGLLEPPLAIAPKSSGDFQSFSFAVAQQDTGGGPNHIVYSFDFRSGLGSDLLLNETERWVVRPNDSFVDLTSHRVAVTGFALDRLP